MYQELQSHDYALAYVIRQKIYEGDYFYLPYYNLNGKEILKMCCKHPLSIPYEHIIKKCPWITSFLNKTPEELWEELPSKENIQSQLYNGVENGKVYYKIAYYIDGKHVAKICNMYFLKTMFSI